MTLKLTHPRAKISTFLENRKKKTKSGSVHLVKQTVENLFICKTNENELHFERFSQFAGLLMLLLSGQHESDVK